METFDRITTRHKKYDVFGLNYSITNYHDATDQIIQHACARKSYTVAALPVHGLIESYTSESYRKVANNIDMVVPDGFPIIWALNRMYKLNLKERICGMDLTLYVLERASELSLKVFLYGSYEKTIQKFCEFIQDNYPGVIICGTHPDRFRESTTEEDLMDIEKINSSGAQIVLVGRGCPRQEYWIESHKNKVYAVMMAIGGAFDVHSQTIKRAPKWMRDRGLEWLYRLMAEPGRMWKRYLFTNSFYILLMTRYNLNRLINKII